MSAIYGIPPAVFWAAGIIALAVGLFTVLAIDRYIACMRGWLLRQLRWLRTPGYRRFMLVNGWVLLLLGALLLVLMALLAVGR